MPESVGLAEALLAQARTSTDSLLKAAAERLEQEVPAPLGTALAYALGTSGKRVRPALVIASYQAAGGSSDAIAGVAAAVEVVHTYSLVHDDLPCMDDDSQRRGRATTHVAFDVPTATRVGWILVPAAVEMLAEAMGRLGRLGRLGRSDDMTMRRRGQMAGILLQASGISGMVGGQFLDLRAEGRTLGLDELAALHARKTGALIRASCMLGGIAAGPTPEVLAPLAAYGREIGLAFQIADDVLDATGTTASLGKTAGRDAALAKSTYVSILGVEGARAEARRHADRAVAHLQGSGLQTGTLTDLAGFIITRTM